MAAETENASLSDYLTSDVENTTAVNNNVVTSMFASEEDDLKYGFKRPEMFKASINNTVDDYDRHVFLVYKSPEAWPAKLEESEADPLPKLFSAAVRSRKKDTTVKTKVTVCGSDGKWLEDGDVVVFPDMIRYRGLKESDVDQFVEEVFVKGEHWSTGEREDVTANFIFVCAHGSRDKRCGVCGPALIDKLREEIGLKSLSESVIISPCSHIGGHKYAGNLIMYCRDPSTGAMTGNWYGYVTPGDVPELLESQMERGQVVDKLWRGQMGGEVNKVETGKELKKNKEPEQKKLANGAQLKKDKEPEQFEKEAVSWCCQGANGISCCKDETLEEEEKSKSGKFSGKLSGCIKSIDQEDIYLAAAVIGAVVTVTIAYKVYKRSTA